MILLVSKGINPTKSFPFKVINYIQSILFMSFKIPHSLDGFSSFKLEKNGVTLFLIVSA